MKTKLYIKHTTIYTLIGFGTGVYLPLLSLYFEETLLYTDKEIGILFSMLFLIPIIALPIWGLITDYIKSPKKSLILAISLTIPLFILFAFIKDFLVVLLTIIVFASIRIAILALYDDILLNLQKEHGIKYNFIRAGTSIGFAVASYFGFFVANLFGNSSIFIFTAIIFVFVVLLLLTIKDVSYEEKTDINIKNDLPELFKNKSYIMTILFTFFIFGVFNTNMTFLSKNMSELGASDFDISNAILIAVIVEPIFFIAGSFINQRFRSYQIIAFIVVLNIVRFLLLYLVPSVEMVIYTAPIHGITFSLSLPIVLKYIQQHVPKKISATALTINGAMMSLGTAIITLVASYYKSITGDIRVFYLVLLIFSLPSVFLIFSFRKQSDEIGFKTQEVVGVEV